MEETITYQQGSATSDEYTKIEHVKNFTSPAKPKVDDTDVCSTIQDSEALEFISCLKSEIKEDDVDDDISFHINNEENVDSNTGNKKIEDSRINIKCETDLKFEEDGANSNIDDEEDVVRVKYWESQINLKEEVDDDISFNTDCEDVEPISNLMKEYVDKHSGDKEDNYWRKHIKVGTYLTAKEDGADSNSDDEEDVPISYLKFLMNLKKEVDDDKYFNIDSEDEESQTNLTYKTVSKQANDCRKYINVETDLRAEEDDAESSTDDEEDVPISYLKFQINLKKEVANDSYLNTDSEDGESISNLTYTTNILKENDDTITGKKQVNDCKKNIKVGTDLMAEKDEDESNTDDEEDELLTELKPHSNRDSDDDDIFTNTNHDEDYETESDNGNSSDYEPEPKRPYLTVPELEGKKEEPDLDVKKKAFGKYNNGIYCKFVIRQCPMCKLEFYTIYDWKQHLNVMHNVGKPEHLQFKYNNSGAKCKLCDFQMTTPNFNKLLNHQITHMPYSHYLKCKLCDWETKALPGLSFHLRQQHAEALHAASKSLELTVCPYCHHKFVSHHKLRSHMIQKHEKSMDNRTLFFCLECDQEFTSNVQLREHIYEKFSTYTINELCFEEMPREGYRSAQLKCTQCPQIFRRIETQYTQFNIREHYMLHLGDSSGKLAYKCKYCAESFRRYRNIRSHDCVKVLQKQAENEQARMLNRKMARNVPLQPVAYKRDYMKHIRHVCLKCGMLFRQLGLCKDHMFVKHGLNKASGLDFKSIGTQDCGTEIYVCILCKEFTCDLDLDTMLVHARTHTMYDPLQCNRCQMTFAYPVDIPGHQCLDEECAKTLNETRPPRKLATVKSTEIPLKGEAKQDQCTFTDTTTAAPAVTSAANKSSFQVNKIIEHLHKMGRFCPKCGTKFVNTTVYNAHVTKIHGFDRPDKLGFEKISRTAGSSTLSPSPSKVTYRCMDCIQFTLPHPDVSAMLEHARKHFPFDSFWCQLCEKPFRLSSEAKLHRCGTSNRGDMETGAGGKCLISFGKCIKKFCPVCNKQMPTFNACLWHMNRYHEMNSLEGLQMKQTNANLVQCLVCQVHIPYKRRYEHRCLHLPFKPYQCKFCAEYFVEFDNARMHCYECKFIPKEILAESVEQKANATIVMSKESKSITDDKDDENDEAMLCEEAIHKSKTERHTVQAAQESDSETLLRMNKIKVRLNKNKMGYFCPKCGKKFVKPCGSSLHLTKVHGFSRPDKLGFEKITITAGSSSLSPSKVIYRCTDCLQFTLPQTDITAMLEHAREHLPFESFWCMLCEKRFRLSSEAKLHTCDTPDIGGVKTVARAKRPKLIKKSIVETQARANCPQTFEKCIKLFCPECNKQRPKIKAWRLHIAKYHKMNTLEGLQMKETNSNLVECLVCQEHVTRKRKYSHRFLHLPFKPYQCKFCAEFFVEIDKARMHCYECKLMPKEILAESGKQKAITTIVKSIAAKQTEVKKVDASVVENCIKLFCPECGNKKPSIRAWYWHIAKYHKMNTLEGLQMKETNSNLVECLVCQEHITRKTKQSHRFLHLPFKPYQCKFCAEFFVEIDKARMHCYECKLMPKEILSESGKQKAITTIVKSIAARQTEVKKVYGSKEKKKESDNIVDDGNGSAMACEQSSHKSKPRKDPGRAQKECESETPFQMIKVKVRLNENKMGYLCPKCGTRFVNKSVCNTHITKVHGFDRPEELGFEKISITAGPSSLSPSLSKVIYRCTDCLQFTLPQPDVSAMLEHARPHLPFDSFWCLLCKKRFRLSSEAELHRCGRLDGGDVGTAAPAKCPQTFENCMKLFCPECNKEMPSITTWRWHIGRYHEMNSLEGLQMKQTNANVVVCLVCQEHITHRRRFSHRFLHLPFNPYQCKFCAEFFVEIHKAKMHCYECKLIPKEILAESGEQKAITADVKSIEARHTEVKKVDASKESKKESVNIVDDENGNAVACEQSSPRKSKPRKDPGRAEQECESETPFQMYKIKERLNKNKMGSFCPKCGTRFVNKSVCNTHITKVHGFDRPDELGFEKISITAGSSSLSPSPSKVIYRCTDCLQFTLPQPDVSAMLEHARVHLPFDSFWCKLCKKRFRLSSEAKLHRCGILNLGDVGTAERATCPQTFEKCIKLFCPECNKELPTVNAWRWHIGRYHELNSLEGLQMKQTNIHLVECLVCQMRIAHSRRYSHRILHLPFKPYQCKFCAEFFVEIHKARMHCYECKLIPKQILADSGEVNAITTIVKGRVARQTEVTKVNASKESKKGSENLKADENHEAKACEESSHKSKTIKRIGQAAQESENETPSHKGISIVLTDEHDYTKFVRIICPICPDSEFETNLALSQHFQETHNCFSEHFTIHNTNAANCKTCNKYFNVISKKTMIRHYLYELNVKCYYCRLCDKAFRHEYSKVRLHLIDQHEAIIAGQSRSTAASSSSSITAVIPTKMPAESDVQKEETTTAKRRVARHTEVKKVDASKETNKEDITDVGNYETMECKSVVHVANESELRIAPVDISKVSRTTMAIHTKKAPVFNKYNAYISYACPECDKLFETSEQWHLHINFEHDFFDEHKLNIEATSDGYKRCTQCNVKISGGVLHEQRHKLTHMQYKSFICTICLHRSTTVGVLIQHLRHCHFAKGEFKCFCCKEVLSTSYERIEHIKSVHDPSEYPRTLCRICFTKVKLVHSLRSHMEMHNPDRPVFKCEFCKCSYLYPRDLKLHKRAKHQGRGRKRTK